MTNGNTAQITDALTWAMCAASQGGGPGKCDPEHCVCAGESRLIVAQLADAGFVIVPTAEIERLRAALTFFADFDKIKGGTPDADMLRHVCNLVCVTAPTGEMLTALGRFCEGIRNARAALSVGEPPSEGKP